MRLVTIGWMGDDQNGDIEDIPQYLLTPFWLSC
jgi:hypothetical protein